MSGGTVCGLALLVALLAEICGMGAGATSARAGRILMEERSTTQRPLSPVRLRTAEAAAPFQDTGPREERLLDDMDVYALSPHARLLALPRMVSPDLARRIGSGRAAFPGPADWEAMTARFNGTDAAVAAPGSVPRVWEGVIRRAAAQYALPPALVAAVIRVESGFDPASVSPKGARGLMQLMPGTQGELGIADPLDPEANVRGGCAYLRRQLDRFGALNLALAAYNAGPGAVIRYKGMPPYPETRAYVSKVLEYYGG